MTTVMELTNNQHTFLELVRAGLWEREVRLLQYDEIDYVAIMRLAEEQSVVGLVTSGLELVKNVKVPQAWKLQFVGSTLQIEQRNKTMNEFVAKLICLLRKNDIYSLLVKGQGVAQCYEKPLWRTMGDVDLYLSNDNYKKAKICLIPLAQKVEQEDKRRLHLGMTIENCVVELHGTMHTGISRRMNRVSDEVHNSLFYGGSVRSWNNNGVQVLLPSPDNDIIIIFNHFINHFYGEGIGLRQVCDWCRLLWTYKDSLNCGLLEQRVRKAGLLIEWKAFAAFAVEYLGMPVEAMPIYVNSSCYKKKADRICKLILETGNFGHNKDESYRKTSSKMKSNMITFWKRLGEFSRLATIFPVNAPIFFMNYVYGRINVA